MLTFTDEDLKTKCNNRLNILRILKNRKWRIKEEVLKSVYYALIRSIIDYTLIVYSVLSEKNKEALQIIQNKALRIIYNCSIEISVNELHRIANEKKISERAIEVKENYLEKNTKSDNPVVKQLLWDFRNYLEQTPGERFPTPLDKLDLEKHGFYDLSLEDYVEMELGISNIEF